MQFVKKKCYCFPLFVEFLTREMWTESLVGWEWSFFRKYDKTKVLTNLFRNKYKKAVNYLYWLFSSLDIVRYMWPWMVFGFRDHLQILTTSNHNALANSCTRLLITAHTKPSHFVFTTRFLVMDSNNVLCLCPYRLANISQLTKLKFKAKVTLRLTVYGQSIHLSAKLLETHDQRFFST
jgi:hypothetical protein